MDFISAFILSLIVMCLAANGALALSIPAPFKRNCLSTWEAPRAAVLEMGFSFFFVAGERSRASTCGFHRSLTSLWQLLCSPSLECT